MSESNLDRENIQQHVDRWTSLVADLPEDDISVPLVTLQGEVVDLAGLLDHYFEPRTVDGLEYPGLNSVVATGRYSPNIPAEMRELQLAIGSVQRRYEGLVKKDNNAPIARADELLQYLRASLSFLLEDGENPEGEAALDKIRDLYSDEQSHDGIAATLEAYSDLASKYQGELSKISGFERAILDESMQVAGALRQRSADKLVGNIVEEQRGALRLRNRMLTALSDRIRIGRRTFRFVFREFPALAQKAGSEYERSRRKGSRRRKSTSEAPQSGVSGPAGEQESTRTNQA